MDYLLGVSIKMGVLCIYILALSWSGKHQPLTRALFYSEYLALQYKFAFKKKLLGSSGKNHFPATTASNIKACTKLPFSAFPLPGSNTTSALALARLPTLELRWPPVLDACSRPSARETETIERWYSVRLASRGNGWVKTTETSGSPSAGDGIGA